MMLPHRPMPPAEYLNDDPADFQAGPLVNKIARVVSDVLASLLRLRTHVDKTERRARDAEARLADVNKLATLWLIGKNADESDHVAGSCMDVPFSDKTARAMNLVAAVVRRDMLNELGTVIGWDDDMLSREKAALELQKWEHARGNHVAVTQDSYAEHRCACGKFIAHEHFGFQGNPGHSFVRCMA